VSPVSLGRWKLWAVAAAVALVGGVIGGVIVDNTRSTSTSQAAGCVVTTVANNVLPSVVTITAAGSSGGGTGSGEVIRSDGYILTNNHVIAVAADGGRVQVTFNNAESAPATIVGRDPQTDLAVLKVTGVTVPKVIAIGSSSDLKVGQPVVALGAPLALSNTVTSGIVSALGRNVEVPSEGDSSALLVDAIQTDAAINPGNSGGALVNCSDDLVGIPSAGATVPTSSGESSGGSIGIGFAIPVNLAITVANEIISTGTVTHSYFGMAVAPIPPAVASKEGVPEGLFVAQVASGGPAAQAGLQADDIITEVNGQAAHSVDQIAAITLTMKPGDTVKLTYYRQGQTHTATVTLGTQP
jgi:putative serine protease PepD